MPVVTFVGGKGFMGKWKNLVEGTLIGGNLVIFSLIGEYHPNPPIVENPVAPKFSKTNKMLDSFTQNLFRKALSFEFTFCLAV